MDPKDRFSRVAAQILLTWSFSISVLKADVIKFFEHCLLINLIWTKFGAI